MALDFTIVAAAALAQAERLCAEWLGGKRQGNEWVGASTKTGGRGDSWRVNLITGQWAHFSGDEKGGDLTALYAALFHVEQLAALHAVAALVGLSNGADGPPVATGDDAPAAPVPSDAGPPPAHPKHGAAAEQYAYRNSLSQILFYQCRYETPSGKTFAQYTWRRHKWALKGFPAPRPMFNLPALAARPTDPVLVTEGEKCALAAAEAFPDHVCVTWASGASAVKQTDWTPLRGRSVDIWPDADVPGAKAAAELAGLLLGLECTVRVLHVEGQPQGWDVADARAAGLDVAAYVADRWRSTYRAPTTSTAKPAPAHTGSALEVWQNAQLSVSGLSNSSGIPHATASNVAAILTNNPYFDVVIFHDDFRGRIYFEKDGVVKAWTDADDLQVLRYIQHHVLLPKVGLATVVNAVQMVAFQNRRNPLQQYLCALKWDGIERLSHWTVDYLGTPATEFTRAVARNWLISMVARAMRPGCQADHVIVLEGKMGIRKSTILEKLGGDWYQSISQAFGSKEFLEAIQGTWLAEIPDNSGLSKRDHVQIISTITIRSDVYRKSYGRHAENHPRTVIFAITTEKDQYLKDTRGTRRFWPLTCTEINVEGFDSVREQLFAEAVDAFNRGATWHEVPEAEALAEQAKRQEGDAWLAAIEQYVISRPEISVNELLSHCLTIEIGRQTQNDANRVARCLILLGYICKIKKIDGRSARIYCLK